MDKGGSKKDAIEKEAQLRALIDQRLIESGERDKLMDYFRAKLVECGWLDDVKSFAAEFLKQKRIDESTADALVRELEPYALKNVPEEIEADFLEQLKRTVSGISMRTDE